MQDKMLHQPAVYFSCRDTLGLPRPLLQPLKISSTVVNSKEYLLVCACTGSRPAAAPSLSSALPSPPPPPPPPPPSPSPSSAAPASPSSSSEHVVRHPWLIVGIGNPGKKYAGTRHNIGFDIVDAIAEAEGIKFSTIQHKSLVGKGDIGSSQVLVAKPQTYVNLIGTSIAPLAAYYRIPVQQILAIFDDTELEFGEMRVLPKGGLAAHSGVRSLSEHIKGSRLFPRLRFGIGKAPGTMDPAAYVLQTFDTSEIAEMHFLLPRAIDTVRQAVTEGVLEAASKWNEIPKSRMRLTKQELEILKAI